MRVNTTDLQNAFGKYLALTEKEDIIVTKNGKSVAKLIHYSEPDFVVVNEETGKYRSTRKISYAEYLALVNSTDQRYELIDGQVFLLASPSFAHQVVVTEIVWHLTNYFKDKPCRPLTAPFDVHLFGRATNFEEDPNVVQPDIVVICDLDRVNADQKYEGTPTLLVEVLSPSTKSKDMVLKLNLYMKSGISEYWAVDLEARQVIQYTFTPDRDIQSLKIFGPDDPINSSTFKGLTIALPEIFAEI